MGNYEYDIDLNMSPNTVPDFNHLPINVANGTPIHLGDLAPVSDTHPPQTNVVRVNGHRGNLSVGYQARRRFNADGRRRGQASDPADSRRRAIKGLKISLTFDQSTFVKGRYGRWCGNR